MSAIWISGFLAPSQALAEGFVSGTFQKTRTGYLLQTTAKKAPLVFVTSTELLEDQVSQLKTGDYLSGQFAYNPSTRIYSLVTIETMGLRALLGLWSDSELNFDFISFSSLKITALSSADGWKKNQVVSFRYTLLPGDVVGEWTLLLANDRDSYYATAQISTRRISLELYDSETGRVIKNIHLSKIPR